MTLACTTSPLVRVSWGELIDKITILEIKSKKIKNEKALVNVRKELTLLNARAAFLLGYNNDLIVLKEKLGIVNEALWQVEDSIRKKDSRNEFDVEFIALARAVFHHNDERARLKRVINELLKSEIVEEKSYEY